MKINDILQEKNSGIAHAKAYAKGCEAGDAFMNSYGQHKGKVMPTCEYEENSEEHRAWHTGFKTTVHTSEWFDGD